MGSVAAKDLDAGGPGRRDRLWGRGGVEILRYAQDDKSGGKSQNLTALRWGTGRHGRGGTGGDTWAGRSGTSPP